MTIVKPHRLCLHSAISTVFVCLWKLAHAHVDNAQSFPYFVHRGDFAKPNSFVPITIQSIHKLPTVRNECKYYCESIVDLGNLADKLYSRSSIRNELRQRSYAYVLHNFLSNGWASLRLGILSRGEFTLIIMQTPTISAQT